MMWALSSLIFSATVLPVTVSASPCTRPLSSRAPMTAGDAARAVQVFDVLRPGGRKLTDIGRLAADVVEDVQRRAQFGFPEYGGQVEGSCWWSRREPCPPPQRCGRIVRSRCRGADVLFEKFHDLHTRLFGKADTGGGRRASCRYGQGHAHGFAQAVHGVGGVRAGTEPQPGQARFPVRSSSSSSVMVPLRTAPTPSNTLMSPVLFRPRQHGAAAHDDGGGRFRRIMAMSMPGTILSQLGMNTSASKDCRSHDFDGVGDDFPRGQGEAHTFMIHGQAVAHGDGQELHSVPPAMRMPALTASAILPRCG